MLKDQFQAIAGYFDLQSERRSAIRREQRRFGLHVWVLPQYIAFGIGVLIEPLLSYYGHYNDMPDMSILGARLVFAMVIGLLLMPNIYKATFNPAKPISLQMLALVLLGLGWQTLFFAAGRAAVGS